MFLVAGLAVAALAGIAAAFYFSIRSGNGGNKRFRPAGAGRARTGRTGRRPGSGRGTAGSGGTGHARQVVHDSRPTGSGRPARASSRDYPAEDDTGQTPELDLGDPALIGGRGASTGSRRLGDRFEPGETQATDPGLVAVKTSESRPGSRSAGRLPREAGETVKPRRRMGFRKGADVDEELWPTEAFGGVSDEQFWDDLAADKPLTTTARTAQQGPGTRKRPLDTGPAADPQAVQAKREDRGREAGAREERGREERGRDERGRSDGRRGAGAGAYSESRSMPNPATERTMIQPSYGATQPVPDMAPQILGAKQVPGVAQVPGTTQPVRTATGGSRPANATRESANASSRPMGALAQPAETRTRRRVSSAEEDPLTSAAFSLRPSGPVDGRSSLRTGGSRSGGSGTGSASTYGGTSLGSSYRSAGASYGDPSSATQAMNTPPHGDSYGHGSRGSAPVGDDLRRPNSTRSHTRPAGAGQGTQPARQADPRDGYPTGDRQGTGSYRGTGSYQGNGSYQGTGSYPTPGYPIPGYPGSGGYPGNAGYPGNGQRAQYDPRENYRRLIRQR